MAKQVGGCRRERHVVAVFLGRAGRKDRVKMRPHQMCNNQELGMSGRIEY